MLVFSLFQVEKKTEYFIEPRAKFERQKFDTKNKIKNLKLFLANSETETDLITMSEIQGVITRIQLVCKQRRIRLEEFMRTYDVHRNKRIFKPQFARALDNVGIRISPDELAALQNAYEDPLDSTLVNYRAFCDQVDAPVVSKGLEQTPTAQIINPLEGVSLHELPVLSQLEQQELLILSQRLSATAQTKGIVIKDICKDFDRNNSGHITPQQFLRNIFSAFHGLMQSEADLLIRAYSTDIGVNYRALNRDICDSAVTKPDRQENKSSSSGISTRSTGHVSTVQTEQQLLDIVKRDRLRVKSFFTEFDRLRTGKCTSDQFKRGLKLCFGAGINQDQMEALAVKYGGQGGSCLTDSVKYSAFCDVMDPNIQYLESNLHQVTTSPNRSFETVLNTSDAEILDILMQRLSLLYTTRRVLMKPNFRDFDRRNRGIVTSEQFLRVLTMFDMMPRTEEEKRVLLQHYGQTAFINFVRFCDDLETWVKPQIPISVSSVANETGVTRSPVALSSVSTVRSVPQLLRYIKERVKHERIRLNEYFRDYDSLRKGKISKAQFASGMSIVGFRLATEEIDALADHYTFYEDALEELTQGNSLPQFAWTRFADEINSIFTQKGLERDPTKNVVEAIREAESSGLDGDIMLNQAEEYELRQILLKIQAKIAQKRLFIKPLFEDFDQMKRGYIPSTKFERALSMFHLLPSNATELSLIIRKFSERNNDALPVDRPDVNYKAFLNALELVGSGTAEIPNATTYRKNRQEVVTKPTIDSRSSRLQSGSPNQVNLDVLLGKLNTQIEKKRIRIKEFIADGDKLRRGEISVSKFHTALNRSGLELEAHELDYLGETFQSSKNRECVNWRAFVEALEANGIQSTSLEKDTFDLSQLSPNVVDLVQRIRSFVSQHRLHMKPYFKDYDRNNSNSVTKSQFAAVLDMMKLNLTPAETNLLTDTFGIEIGRKPTKDINYRQFVQLITNE